MQITVGPKIPESGILPLQGSPSSGYLSTKNYKEVQGTATANTSFDIPLQIPANSKIVATSLRVDVELTSSDGGSSFTAQFIGGSALQVTTTGAFTQNYKENVFHDAIGSATSDVTNLRITCNNSKTFSAGGKITAVVYYQSLTSLQSV